MRPKTIVNWQVMLGIGLILASVLIYAVELLVFHDRRAIAVVFLNDLAFVPISVLLVSLVLDQIMQGRDKRNRLNKTNMVIGAFFSAVGIQLLRTLAALDLAGDKISLSQPAFEELRQLLAKHRDFMLRLLENQTLLEHEQFTDLLWASFHLADELSLRGNYEALPEPDRQHLALDAKRVYAALSKQWVDYLAHLKTAYPYLYSLAVRMDPFAAEARPIVRSA
jgi:hypothetical protein